MMMIPWEESVLVDLVRVGGSGGAMWLRCFLTGVDAESIIKGSTLLEILGISLLDHIKLKLITSPPRS